MESDRSYVYTLRLIGPISCMLYTYEGNKMHSWEYDAVLSCVNHNIASLSQEYEIRPN